jgi:CheY-like chemotaxis protein
MSKTLVVSDNEILNQLYVINLEVYLATEVKLVLTTQIAQELIEAGENYDLVITMNMINGLDSAITLFEFLKTKNLTTPLVVIGNPVKEIPDIIVVQSSYHLKNLLRACADILGITAKSMAALDVPEYYSVDTKFLMRLGEAPCQIFLQVKKSSDEINYAMVAKKGSNTTEILRKFLSEGIANLYVNKLDRLLVINQISKILCDFIKSTENLGMVEKSAALEAGFEFVASDFCQSPEATQEVMNIANSCTKVMEEISKETPGLRALVQLLNSNKNGYIYSHSILSSFIASHIVKKVSWGGESHLEKINFVLFFHDIMLAPIYLKHPTLKYEEDLLFSDELSVKEKELVLNHARMAAELVITYRRSPMGADLLIKQHHGMTNGIGFAIDYKDDISPLSKIVIISEAFVEEYMKGKDNDPNYQIDLKKIIPTLIEKFKKSTYKKIIETLESIKL